MLEGFATALALFVTPEVVLALAAGTAIGFVVALLPGIGGAVTMAVLLPLTFGMEPTPALIFLVAIMSAGGFAGAVTQILMRVPGDSNVASMLDGYPLARAGKGSEAIGAAVGGSVLGAAWGIFLLIASLPILRRLSLLFGPPELFVIALAGVILIAAMSGSGSPTKAIISGGIGMIAGSVGFNLVTGEVRFAFGQPLLWEGIPLVPVVAGVFAIPELFALMQRNQSVSLSDSLSKGGVMRGFMMAVTRPRLVIQSSAIGAGIGAIPGVGSAVSTWIAYYAAQATSKSPQTFGFGNIEGVIAPEASRDAREGGSMIPLLALGVPGGVATAILLSGFMIHGVDAGPRLFQGNMTLVWALILTILFANAITGSFGLLTANQIAKVTLVPTRILVPIVLTTLVLGSYVVTRSFYGVVVALASGAVGMAMVRLGYARPPLILGLILFPIMERNFYSSLQIYDSYLFLLNPIVIAILLMTLLTAVGPRLWRRFRRSPAAGRSSGTKAIVPPPLHRDDLPGSLATSAPNPPLPQSPVVEPAAPLLWHLAASLVLLASGIVLISASFNYSYSGRQFPLGILIVFCVLVLADTINTVRRLTSRGEWQVFRGSVTPDGPPVNSFPMTWAWLLALPVLLWAVGILLGIFVYVVSFMIWFERAGLSGRKVFAALAAGLIVVMIVHYVFGVVMGVNFASGVVPLPSPLN